MKKIIYTLLITMFFFQSCTAQQALNTPTSIAIAIKETPDMSTMPSPSIIIDPRSQRGRVVSVSVGDVFSVALPQESSKWAVDYANSVIEPLTPAEKMNEPGTAGWFFRAIAVGQTDIVLTASAAKCPQPPPCPPPAPIRYLFTIDVK